MDKKETEALWDYQERIIISARNKLLRELYKEKIISERTYNFKFFENILKSKREIALWITVVGREKYEKQLKEYNIIKKEFIKNHEKIR